MTQCSGLGSLNHVHPTPSTLKRLVRICTLTGHLADIRRQPPLTQLRHRDPLLVETDRGGLFGCVGDHYFGFWPAPILKAIGKLRPAEVRYASALRSSAARMAACVAAS